MHVVALRNFLCWALPDIVLRFVVCVAMGVVQLPLLRMILCILVAKTSFFEQFLRLLVSHEVYHTQRLCSFFGTTKVKHIHMLHFS